MKKKYKLNVDSGDMDTSIKIIVNSRFLTVRQLDQPLYETAS